MEVLATDLHLQYLTFDILPGETAGGKNHLICCILQVSAVMLLYVAFLASSSGIYNQILCYVLLLYSTFLEWHQRGENWPCRTQLHWLHREAANLFWSKGDIQLFIVIVCKYNKTKSNSLCMHQTYLGSKFDSDTCSDCFVENVNIVLNFVIWKVSQWEKTNTPSLWKKVIFEMILMEHELEELTLLCFHCISRRADTEISVALNCLCKLLDLVLFLSYSP